jgi:hypothetical protein
MEMETNEPAGPHMSEKHMGSSLDDFLKEEGMFEEIQARAVREVAAWQLAELRNQKMVQRSENGKS